VELPALAGAAPLDDPIPAEAEILGELEGFSTAVTRGAQRTIGTRDDDEDTGGIMMVTARSATFTGRGAAGSGAAATPAGKGKGKGKGQGKGKGKGTGTGKGKDGSIKSTGGNYGGPGAAEDEVPHPRSGMIKRPPAGHIDVKNASFAEPAARPKSGRGNKHGMSLYEPPRVRDSLTAGAFDAYDPRTCGPVPRVSMSELEREERDRFDEMEANAGPPSEDGHDEFIAEDRDGFYGDDDGGYVRPGSSHHHNQQQQQQQQQQGSLSASASQRSAHSPTASSRSAARLSNRPEDIAGDAPYDIPPVRMPNGPPLDTVGTSGSGGGGAGAQLTASKSSRPT
jgi:hypothetical protein